MLPPLMPKPIKKSRPAALVPARGNNGRARAMLRIVGIRRNSAVASRATAAPNVTSTASAD